MYSVLFDGDGSVVQLGPFKRQADTFHAAKQAHDAKKFDLNDQFVYLIDEKHKMYQILHADVK